MRSPHFGGWTFGEVTAFGQSRNGGVLPPTYLRSAFCTGGSCFEWLELDDMCLLRDSKSTQGETITMRTSTWASLKAHFLDAESADMVQLDSVTITHRSNGWVDVADIETGIVLSYNPEEVRDFIAGLASNRFVAVA